MALDYFLRFPRLKSAYLRPWADLSRFEKPFKSAQIGSNQLKSALRFHLKTIFGFPRLKSAYLRPSNQLKSALRFHLGLFFVFFLRFPRLKSAYLRPWADLRGPSNRPKSAEISSNQLWGFILDYFWGFQGSNQLILDLQISSNQLWGFILGYFLMFPRLKSAYLRPWADLSRFEGALKSAQISSNQLWGFIFDYF